MVSLYNSLCRWFEQNLTGRANCWLVSNPPHPSIRMIIASLTWQLVTSISFDSVFPMLFYDIMQMRGHQVSQLANRSYSNKYLILSIEKIFFPKKTH